MHLVTVTRSTLLDLAVPTQVEDRRCLFRTLSGQVEIPRDVEPWSRLKMELLDHEFVVFGRARDHCMKGCLLGKRIEPQHVKQLLPIFVTASVPIRQ